MQNAVVFSIGFDEKNPSAIKIESKEGVSDLDKTTIKKIVSFIQETISPSAILCSRHDSLSAKILNYCILHGWVPEVGNNFYQVYKMSGDDGFAG